MNNVTHEIVTLQLGHYANFVGAHWWNTQEASFIYDPKLLTGPKEINHDVMFREGHNLQGEVTFTPRLILLDLKDSLNTLKQDGHLYDMPESPDDVCWSSDVTMHKSISLPKNEFLRDLEKQDVLEGEPLEGISEADTEEIEKDDLLTKTNVEISRKLYNLDDSVKVWSDYLRIHLHPRTIDIVEQYTHGSDMEVFSLYPQGRAVYRDLNTRQRIEDKIHFFIEECDHLQGLQLVTDIHDGFGGISGSLLQDLEDELGSKSLLVIGTSPALYNNMSAVQDAYRMMTMALTLENLTNHCSAFIPISLATSYASKARSSAVFPHLNYKPQLTYHSSAVLAAALDTMSLPHRLDAPPALLSHLTGALTPGGRKWLGLFGALPFAVQSNSTLTDTLLDLGDTLPWQPLTPGCHGSKFCTAQSLVLRGLPQSKFKSARASSRQLSQCDTVNDLLSLYLNDMCNCSLNAICNVREACKVAAPFPHIFAPSVMHDGMISNTPRPSDQAVEHVPVMTSLQSTNAVGDTVRELLDKVQKLNLKRHHKILDEGLEEDDVKESFQNLHSHLERYDES